jgi:hypothetical protein
MARITKIMYSRRTVHNVGNYESVHVEVGAEVVVDEDDDREKVKSRLVRTVDKWHDEESERLLEEHAASK